MKDLDQNMEDFIVESFTDPYTEMGEGALTRDPIHTDTRVGSISSAPVLIPERFQEVAHILEAVNIPEQIQQKQTHRVIARRPEDRITICHQGPYKRKINQ